MWSVSMLRIVQERKPFNLLQLLNELVILVTKKSRISSDVKIIHISVVLQGYLYFAKIEWWWVQCTSENCKSMTSMIVVKYRSICYVVKETFQRAYNLLSFVNPSVLFREIVKSTTCLMYFFLLSWHFIPPQSFDVVVWLQVSLWNYWVLTVSACA